MRTKPRPIATRAATALLLGFALIAAPLAPTAANASAVPADSALAASPAITASSGSALASYASPCAALQGSTDEIDLAAIRIVKSDAATTMGIPDCDAAIDECIAGGSCEDAMCCLYGGPFCEEQQLAALAREEGINVRAVFP